jgi:hypothetical protein
MVKTKAPSAHIGRCIHKLLSVHTIGERAPRSCISRSQRLSFNGTTKSNSE